MAAPPQKPLPSDPQQAQDASGRARNAGDELADACTALEAEVEELKVKYEMYFLGVELREPVKWREDLKKKVVKLKEQFTRNTGLRFRLQTLHARFLSYERLWLRSAREREDGTYRRDVYKARLHARGKAPGKGGTVGARAHLAAHHDGEDVDLSDFGDDVPPAPPAPAAKAPTAAPAPAAAAKPPAAALAPAKAPAPKPAAPAAPPPAGASSRLPDAAMRELYDAYVTAKKRCNEDTSGLTYDAVARSVSKQIPEIMRQHKAKSVEFRVVIKDGKAKLTAVPKI